MNKAIIVGSAREGNSLYIARKIKEIYGKSDCRIIRLSDYKIEYCTGCLCCDETQKCIINDNMGELIEHIRSSDTMIMITPTRYSLMSGDIKVFIDRLNPTATSEELVGKKMINIAIGQTDETDESVDEALKSLKFFGNNAGLEITGEFSLHSCIGKNDARENEHTEKICNDVARIL